jgi:4-hydroxy-2,2'-bipyrrole-5-carbaldehyde O-methyltransferase
MTLRTLAAELRSGGIGVSLAVMRVLRGSHRAAFLAAGIESGLFARLAAGPVSLERLAADLGVAAGMEDGLAAWLDAAVAAGILRREPAGWALHGLARRLVRPEHDPAAALVVEAAALHHRLIRESPARWRDGRRLTLADQDGALVARSSRMLEPWGCEAVDMVVPARGPVRLLEIGCGSGVYVAYAARRNPELTALGLELQPEVAAVAAAAMARAGLAGRVRIETGDVMRMSAAAEWDVATLQNNINYFPPDRRVAVLSHVRGCLRAGGRVLVTVLCRDAEGGGDVLDLWGAMTAGCGRLPTRDELVAQLGAAGFVRVGARAPIPGQRFVACVGHVP